MDEGARCPRCARELSPPNVWSSAWQCPEHGSVPPMHPAPDPTADWMRHVSLSSRVPVWLPWPLPDGWVVSGIAPVGDDVGGIAAVATALSGPSPLGGPAEILIVAEEPGVGFAAGRAGLTGTDPGGAVDGPPYTHVDVEGHPVPLWVVPTGGDHAVVVGERDLVWIWVAVRPASAGVLLVDDLAFVDARSIGEEIRLLPYGSRSPWLDDD